MHRDVNNYFCTLDENIRWEGHRKKSGYQATLFLLLTPATPVAKAM